MDNLDYLELNEIDDLKEWLRESQKLHEQVGVLCEKCKTDNVPGHLKLSADIYR